MSNELGDKRQLMVPAENEKVNSNHLMSEFFHSSYPAIQELVAALSKVKTSCALYRTTHHLTKYVNIKLAFQEDICN